MAQKEYEADVELLADNDGECSERSLLESEASMDISGPRYKLTKGKFMALIFGT